MPKPLTRVATEIHYKGMDIFQATVWSHSIEVTIIKRNFCSTSSMIWNNRIQWWTHWCRVTHICVGNLPITDSDNGLAPSRTQRFGSLMLEYCWLDPIVDWTNFSEILIETHAFSLKKMHLKMLSEKIWSHLVSASMCQAELDPIDVALNATTIRHIPWKYMHHAAAVLLIFK